VVAYGALQEAYNKPVIIRAFGLELNEYRDMRSNCLTYVKPDCFVVGPDVIT